MIALLIDGRMDNYVVVVDIVAPLARALQSRDYRKNSDTSRVPVTGRRNSVLLAIHVVVVA